MTTAFADYDAPALLEAALTCARMGWPVFPLNHPVFTDSGVRCSCPEGAACRNLGKHPLLKDNWRKIATTDEATIREWWRRHPFANVGIATGVGAGLWVLDIDAPDALVDLEARFGKLPDTVEVATGRGRHLYFREPLPTRNANKFVLGADAKATGGYVVAAGSMHRSGRRYEWALGRSPSERALAEAPGGLLDLVNRGGAKARPKGQVALPTPAPANDGLERAGWPPVSKRIERAIKLIAAEPGAVQGEDGSGATFRVALALTRGLALDVETAYGLLAQYYNPKCKPDWTPKELRHKVETAATDGRLPLGYLLDAPPGKRVQLEEIRESAGELADEGDERPTVTVSVELHHVVDQALEILKLDKKLYQRDGELVRIVRTAETEADASNLEGTPTIRRIAPATLRERLTRLASWQRSDGKGGWRKCMPSDHVTQALAARGEFPGVPPIVGVAEAPLLSADGSVLERKGYDKATGYVYLPNATFPPVPQAPTRDDARRALAELAEVFCDFPYRSGTDRMLPVAAVLTMLARPAIRGSVPAFVFDANTRGSGKTKQVDAASIIATGRESAKMNYPSDDAELEKVLGAYALRGAAMIAFDNITGSFGGGPLDRVLTAGDFVELRVLGKSEIPTLRWRSVVLATGNNVEVVGDTSRRVLLGRLESPLERPEDREGFRHPNLLEWVLANRPRLVTAGLTILRAFVVAGRPRGECKAWGSFEAWSALVPPAIVYAGGADPMGCRLTVDAEDPEHRALVTILEHWPRLAPEGMTAKAAVETLYSIERLQGRAAPDGFDELREAIEVLVPTAPGKAPSTNRLGFALRRFRRRVARGRLLDTAQARAGVVRWVVRDGGDGGLGGDVSTFARESVGSGDLDARRVGAETSQPRQPSPPFDFDDVEREAIQAEGSRSWS